MSIDRHGLHAALLTLAERRDPAAWGLLVERCQPTIERLVRRLSRDAEAAADATQEAWLQIRDGAGGYRGRGDDPDAGAWGWIKRVAANAALQQHRRLRPTLAAGAEPEAPGQPDPIQRTEVAAAVRAALADLPEPTRAAVVLHHMEGLPFQHVADALGCSSIAAKVRAHRGLALLRRRLAPVLGTLALGTALQQLQAAECVAGVPLPSPAGLLDAPALALHPVPVAVAGVLAGAAPYALIGVLLVAIVCAIHLVAQPASELKPAAVAAAGADPSLVVIRPGQVMAAVQDRRFEETFAQRTHSARAEDAFQDLHRGYRLFFDPEILPLIRSAPDVPLGLNSREVLDRISVICGVPWQQRGASVIFMGPDQARRLACPIDGAQAPVGPPADQLAWLSRTSGLTFLGVETMAGRSDQWRLEAMQASAEAWLIGFASALHCSVQVPLSGPLRLVPHPTAVPMLPLEVPDQHWQINPPPPARLECEISLDFKEATLGEVRDFFKRVTPVPIAWEGDPTGMPPISLCVDRMQLRYILEFICKVTGCGMEIRPDRVRIVLPFADPANPRKLPTELSEEGIGAAPVSN